MSDHEPPPPEAFADRDLTEDAFLGGRLKLRQPRAGYRAATDPFFLAAAAPVKAGERVLDVGCGAGAAGLALALRAPRASVEGVERAPAYAALSRVNALRNGVSWLAHAGDIREAPLFVRSAQYDHVITNPPYYAAHEGAASPDRGKDAANRETMPLSDWLDFCLRRLKDKGVLTLIHRAERLDEIVSVLYGRVGAMTALPLWPRAGEPAKRVVVRAVKSARGPFRLAAGLVVHRSGAPADDACAAAGAAYTAEAEAILRDGAALDF